MNKNFLFIVLVLLALSILGVEGCTTTFGGGTTAGKSGIEFSPASGIGYLSAGKEILQNDIFNVGVNIENFDQQEHSGQVCIRDDVASDYGGIPKDECQNFYLKTAELISKDQLQSAKNGIIFPSGQEYTYHDIPLASQPANLFIDLKYVLSSKVAGTITVPTPEAETVILDQTSAPVSVSVEKTIRKKAEGYQLDVGITLQKTMSDAIIYSPDFLKENTLLMKLNSPSLSFTCTPDLGNKGILEFGNTKFIRCSALISQEEQIGYPLVINLDYGVKITRTYNFNIKSEVQK